MFYRSGENLNKRTQRLKNHVTKNLNQAKKHVIARSIGDTCKDYFKETSIHGCRYIGDDIKEKYGYNPYMKTICCALSNVLWVVSISLGIIFAFYLWYLIYIRFMTTPTIMTIETNNYPIWNVQFPGVTICNVNSVYKPNTRNITSALQQRGFSNHSIEMYFESLAALVNFREINEEYLSISDTLEKIGYTTEQIMFEVSQPCGKLIRACMWLGQYRPCENLFRIAKSAEGFCCSFNYKALRSQYEIYFRDIISVTLWILIICLGFIFGIFLMTRVWIRFMTTPTIMTIETYNYPIWNVQFPGVTICNVNSVYKPNTLKIAKILKQNGISQNLTNTFFESLAVLINLEEVDSEFLKVFEILQNYDYSTEGMMFELAQPCENLLKDCNWLGKSISCGTLFRIAKSGFGFCCSFNYKALRSRLEIETKADDYNQINTPVIRISGAGEDVGLRVLLDVEPEHYVAAKRFFYGAEIIIHDPEDFPEKSLLTAFGQPGLEVSMAVMPSVVVTEKSAESLAVNLRFCRLSYEKKLQITKKYSFQSCITECRTFKILEKCNCLPFFLPSVYYTHNKSTQHRQCTLKDVKCLSDNKHVFASLEPPLEILKDMYNIINTTNIGMTCDCLPSCSEQIYNVQTFVSQRFNEINNTAIRYNLSNVDNLTLVKVYFKDFSCIKYRREIFMTWDDLLASFGGIFGLCLGGSVLSLFEIIYFVTFKFYAKLISNKNELKKQKEHEIFSKNIQTINFNKTKFIPVSEKYKKHKEFLW